MSNKKYPHTAEQKKKVNDYLKSINYNLGSSTLYKTYEQAYDGGLWNRLVREMKHNGIYLEDPKDPEPTPLELLQKEVTELKGKMEDLTKACEAAKKEALAAKASADGFVELTKGIFERLVKLEGK